MIATAYILIKIKAGDTRKVYQQLVHMDGVVHVDAISGPYDIIVTVQAPNVNMIGRLVIDKIQKIDGITDTLTCDVINLET